MVTRRFLQTTSDDEEGDEGAPPKPSSSDDNDDEEKRVNRRVTPPRRGRRNNHPIRHQKRRKKLLRLSDDEEEEEESEQQRRRGRKSKVNEEEEEEDDEEEPVQEDAKPIGEVIRVSGKGRGQRKYYKEFEFDGNRFELEDPVLLTPEDKNQKPYVAIIKEIAQTRDGSIMVLGQWFYRPEEAEKKGGGSWQACDTRELFYSFHRDEVPAESVMHKCVVHFVPLHKQLPKRKDYPGFIVQKVYDTVEKKLWKLTDKDYEDGKQEEIDVLVQKTISRLGDLPDVETEDTPANLEEQTRNKRMLRKRHVSPLDVTREDEGSPRSDQNARVETPGSGIDKTSKHYIILAEAKVLTKETHRDKWLEKLLQAVEHACTSTDNVQGEKGENGANGISDSSDDKKSSLESSKGQRGLNWPDSAVSAVVALERASHETLSSDFMKYNQKLRQLVFNLKATGPLAYRLLKGELEPSKILNMTPTELKDGLTEEEMARNQPEETASMQMTDARCKRCNERKVGVVDIIQAGHGDRYQLECIACGNSWFASRDEVTMLTIDGPSNATSVGTAPWATSKFENVEKKKMLSPRETQNADAVKKKLEASMPTLETQRSFNKARPPDDATTPKSPTQKSLKSRAGDAMTPKSPKFPSQSAQLALKKVV